MRARAAGTNLPLASPNRTASTPRQPARAVAEPPNLHRSDQYHACAVQGVSSDHWRLAFWVREPRHVRQGEVVSTAA